MKRWQQERKLLKWVKAGLGSLLICIIVIFLPLLAIRQWQSSFAMLRTNEATPLPAFVNRPVDTKKVPQLFDEPLISITFDDGWETTYTIAAPLLMKNGIHSTQYIVTGVLKDSAYLSLDQVKALQKKGQQISCHTVSHPDLTALPAPKLNEELRACQEYFDKEHLGSARDFAAPYGHTNQPVAASIEQIFRSARNTNGDISNGVADVDINLPENFNPHNIIGVTVHHDTTVAQLQAAVDYAIAHNGWLVLTYHQAEEAGSKFSLSSASLEKQLAYLSGTPVRIVTVGQVMDGLEAKSR